MSIENIMAGAADAIKAQYESAKKHIGEAVDNVAHSSLAEKVSKAVAEIFEAFNEIANAFIGFVKSLFERKVEVFNPAQPQPVIPQDAKLYQAPQVDEVESKSASASASSEEEEVEESDEEVSDVSVDSSDEDSDDEVEAAAPQGIMAGGCIAHSEEASAPSYKKAALKAAILTGSVAALGYAAYKAYEEGYLSEESYDQVKAYVSASVANVTLPQIALPAMALPNITVPNVDLSGLWNFFGNSANVIAANVTSAANVTAV